MKIRINFKKFYLKNRIIPRQCCNKILTLSLCEKGSFNRFIRWILLSQISSGWFPINLGMLSSARNLSFMFKQSFTTMHYDSGHLSRKASLRSKYNVSVIKLCRGISTVELGGLRASFYSATRRPRRYIAVAP